MGSKTAAANRQRQREDNTAQLMENIMTGGEISKAREAELQRAANAGRGVTFLPGSPTVQGLTQGDGRPVFRTGTTAQDFTGRIVANQPTFGEAIGDASRALFGGQAERPFFTSPDAPPGRETGLDFANMVPAPERTQGIIPAIANTGGITGIVLNTLRNLIPGQGNRTTTTPMPSGFTSDQAYFIPQDASVRGLQREPLIGIIERNRLKQLIENDDAPGSEDLNVDAMSDREVELRLSSYEGSLASGGRVGFSNGGSYKDSIQELADELAYEVYDMDFIDLSGAKQSEIYERAIRELQGLMIDAADQYRSEEAKGGLIAPKSGPQSEGIESLFKNK